jgi:hypothetical protein
MDRATRRARIPQVVVASLALGAAACFTGPTFERDRGPGPSDDITTSVDRDAPVSGTMVTCEGPDDQVAMLGSLCGFDGGYWSWNAHVGDQSTYFGHPETTDAVLLLMGFYTEQLPEHDYDHTADIRYAASLVLDPPAPVEGDGWQSERTLMRSWTEGEALTGEIVTRRAVGTACGTDFIGHGVLVWRDTTITLSWISALPC